MSVVTETQLRPRLALRPVTSVTLEPSTIGRAVASHVRTKLDIDISGDPAFVADALAEVIHLAIVASEIDVGHARGSAWRSGWLSGRLRELQRQGLIRWGGGFLEPIQPIIRIRQGETLADIVVRDRR